ncbi:hypothetical protein MMC10_008627 [Thelotrema lepadinum]|nr:hypothetical protein [Thelotrema lepadinum]
MGSSIDGHRREPQQASLQGSYPISTRQENIEDDDLKNTIARQSSHQPSGEEEKSPTFSMTLDPNFEVDWEGDDDPDNPLNWSTWYKGLVIATLSWATLVVVMYSTSYTAGIYQMQSEFDIASEPVVTLGVTTYLLGIALGVLVAAPLSEMCGRRIVFLISMTLFIVLVIPTGIGSSLAEVVAARFFGALFAAALITNAPGTLGDISRDEHRALIFSIWSIGPFNGPVAGPIFGGFVAQALGWRWVNWITMMLGFVALLLLCCMRETYAPIILRKKALRQRAVTGDSRWHSRYDAKESLWTLLKVNFSRPIVMACTEPICIFWNVYIGIVYGILYLCFVAYPIVFTKIREWDIGITGLSFLGTGVGALIAIFLEPLFRRMIQAHKKDPKTGKPPLDAMMSVVCLGAIASPIGQLWFAWTCIPPVHWIWPILAGIPFGFGNVVIFIYGISYLTGCYGLYAASANAGNTLVRSILGATLPLAGPAMYTTLGPNWAASLCGFLLVAIIPTPFIFYKYGSKFRNRSTLIKDTRAELARLDGRSDRAEPKVRHADTEKALEAQPENEIANSEEDSGASTEAKENESGI